MAEPTTTTPLTTTGGDVISYSPSSTSPTSCFRSTWPAAPNDGQGVPVFASMAMSRASSAARKMVAAQIALSCAAGSRQAATPRETRLSE